MTPQFTAALGGMVGIPQFFLWRMDWHDGKQKYLKRPCHLDGRSLAEGESSFDLWVPYETACAALAALPSHGALAYTLGFYMTPGCGYWFLDLDNCVANGECSPFANALVQRFPGAFLEYSSSGNGVHVIGRGDAPDHGCKNSAHNLEFYTEGRGIAFNRAGVAWGSADTMHQLAVCSLVTDYFPPDDEIADYVPRSGPRDDWKGPTDDAELLQRAMRSTSAAAAFGGKATFAQLYRGEVEQNNEHDMALAAHLAFWTGCDEARIERLMLASGLVRPKWHTRRRDLTYLTFSIRRACARCERVYREPERSQAPMLAMYGPPAIEGGDASGSTLTVVGDVISPEQSATMEALLDDVAGCGTLEDMHNIIIPRIRGAGLPRALSERLVKAVNKQLDTWDAKLQLGQLRALINPPRVATQYDGDTPLWVQQHCYVQAIDKFYDFGTGFEKSRSSFEAEYARNMPLRENGQRDDPIAWALDRWNMVVVNRLAYRPDQPMYFEWDSMAYANSYNPATVPAHATEYTQAGIDAINAFKQHLWRLCSGRQWVYAQLLSWMAHNVQKPGVKIRFCPVIQGIEGDGKSIIGNVMRAAMGFRNVGVTGNETLCNNGGFTDWATGCAVNAIEEIMVTGKERYRVHNLVKQYVSNSIVSINAKGGKPYTIYNTTNHIAFTNHVDGVPISDKERRWFVIFSPVTDATGLDFSAIFDSLDREPGQWRSWLLTETIAAEFNPNGHAPETEERARMRASGKDDAEIMAAEIIATGSYGITPTVLSSGCLSNLLKTRALTEGFDMPKTSNLSHMLSRMGFSQLATPVKWDGKTHRVWVKQTMEIVQIKQLLDETKQIAGLQVGPGLQLVTHL